MSVTQTDVRAHLEAQRARSKTLQAVAAAVACAQITQASESPSAAVPKAYPVLDAAQTNTDATTVSLRRGQEKKRTVRTWQRVVHVDDVDGDRVRIADHAAAATVQKAQLKLLPETAQRTKQRLSRTSQIGCRHAHLVVCLMKSQMMVTENCLGEDCTQSCLSSTGNRIQLTSPAGQFSVPADHT